MKIKGLHARLTLIFILAATLIFTVASLVILLEVHYHFKMFQMDAPNFRAIQPLTLHFERAVLGSILWTSVGVFLLVCFLSYIVAKKLSKPLVNMRKVAEEMAKGDLKTRVKTQGHDELQELGLSLNELASQLENQEIARQNMTSDIAHELRTPLATLKSHIEAIEDGIFEATPERLHSFGEEIERLISLVEDLEQLTTFEAPGFVLEKEQEDLGNVIQQSLNPIKESYVQKGVMLSSSNADIQLPLDKKRMMQVFINLLSNALKFTPAGGTVTVATKKLDSKAQIIITDTGIGISDEEAQKVFERFYRTEKSRNRRYGGSGIGLAIAKQLVEAHEGRIWIESVPEKGTAVYITLPLS
ncbi:HAMP domain-containing sensor histidine kinase [Fictibacillus fluitans]|uniref:histidine kinase n=1 Tax=Fictibacillus fluitans TaxID=3058422 RepID=A0ABT8HZ21_9BACL|nr:ATP-binding protein [Fictibacillus sp. NE201]MDN4525512.1 ATP-binding protein [Fictibacillus sp. NE201]